MPVLKYFILSENIIRIYCAPKYGKKPNSDHRGVYRQSNNNSLVVDDPLGFRLDIWRVGNYAAHIFIFTIQVLDDLESRNDMRGFGGRFHEGNVSLI